MLLLGEGLLREALTTLRRCGDGRHECVIYWTSRAATDTLDETLHPDHLSDARGYEVDQAWLNDLWRDLARRGRRVRMQVHTHPGPAFHSTRDDAYPVVQTAGFLSLVVPNLARADDLRGAYLARLADDGAFHPVSLAREITVTS